MTNFTSKSQLNTATALLTDQAAINAWLVEGHTVSYPSLNRQYAITGYTVADGISKSPVSTAVSPSIVASVNAIASDYEALNTRLQAQESKSSSSTFENITVIDKRGENAPTLNVIPADVSAYPAASFAGDKYIEREHDDFITRYTSDGTTFSELTNARRSVVPDSVTAIDSRVASAEAESKAIKQEMRRTTTQLSGSAEAHTKYPFEVKDSITNAMLFDANDDYVRQPFDANGYEWWTLGGLGDNTKYPYDPDLAPFFLEWTTVTGYEPIVRLARCQYMATNGITLAQLQVEPSGSVVGDIVAGWMKLEDLV